MVNSWNKEKQNGTEFFSVILLCSMFQNLISLIIKKYFHREKGEKNECIPEWNMVYQRKLYMQAIANLLNIEDLKVSIRWSLNMPLALTSDRSSRKKYRKTDHKQSSHYFEIASTRKLKNSFLIKVWCFWSYFLTNCYSGIGGLHKFLPHFNRMNRKEEKL